MFVLVVFCASMERRSCPPQFYPRCGPGCHKLTYAGALCFASPVSFRISYQDVVMWIATTYNAYDSTQANPLSMLAMYIFQFLHFTTLLWLSLNCHAMLCDIHLRIAQSIVPSDVNHCDLYQLDVPMKLMVGIMRIRMLGMHERVCFALAVARINKKSNLKFNHSNDVLNSKWVSENSHSFIEQCCVGTPITGF